MTPDTTGLPRLTPEHAQEFDETMMYVPSDLDSTLMRDIESVVRSLSSGETVNVPRADLLGLLQAVERLQDALAKRELQDWNDSRETPSEWPAGQSWDELVGTSHAIFRQRARQEAGINRTPTFREKIDELYRLLDVDCETEPLAGWLSESTPAEREIPEVNDPSEGRIIDLMAALKESLAKKSTPAAATKEEG